MVQPLPDPPGVLGRGGPDLEDADAAVVRAAAETFLPQLDAVSDAVSRAIRARHPGLFREDDVAVATALHLASFTNSAVAVTTLAYGVAPEDAAVPEGGFDIVEHAVASKPASLTAVLAAFRTGSTGLTQVWLAHLAEHAASRAQLARLTRASIDHVERYAETVSDGLAVRWAAAHPDPPQLGDREAALRDILEGRPADPHRLGHPLDRNQVCFASRPVPGTAAAGWPEAWSALAGSAAATLATDLTDGTAVLLIATRARDVVATAPRLPGRWCGVGRAGAGVDGLREAFEQAHDALRILALTSPGGGSAEYAEVALAATLLADERRARRFAREALGPLAGPGAEAERLRRTLDAYFRAAGRKTGAAAILGLHEKTVAARLGRAEELLGGPVEDRRAELEAALLVVRALDHPPVGAEDAPGPARAPRTRRAAPRGPCAPGGR